LSLLFVYGTLRRGGTDAHLMSGAEFLGEASIAAVVVQRGGYPGLVHGGGSVQGELFEVPEVLWLQLDEYEGPGYVCRLSDVEFGGETVRAWVYWLASSRSIGAA
jgi:gamma-glutamylcyclotransferase (GGCT)/AIG2-like uncharacterized protein YtfP